MCEVKLPFGVDHYPVYEKPIEIGSGGNDHHTPRVLDIYVEKRTRFWCATAKRPSNSMMPPAK